MFQVSSHLADCIEKLELEALHLNKECVLLQPVQQEGKWKVRGESVSGNPASVTAATI
jgi:hypothetical protein